MFSVLTLFSFEAVDFLGLLMVFEVADFADDVDFLVEPVGFVAPLLGLVLLAVGFLTDDFLAAGFLDVTFFLVVVF
ncbi:MAG: hypothetical protein VW239_03315, partial [Candidatus Nanopelagicales bacterium]